MEPLEKALIMKTIRPATPKKMPITARKEFEIAVPRSSPLRP